MRYLILVGSILLLAVLSNAQPIDTTTDTDPSMRHKVIPRPSAPASVPTCLSVGAHCSGDTDTTCCAGSVCSQLLDGSRTPPWLCQPGVRKCLLVGFTCTSKTHCCSGVCNWVEGGDRNMKYCLSN